MLAAAASELAAGGPDAVHRALAAVVRALSLRSAALRDLTSGGALRAVAGEVVHAVPHSRGASAGEPVVELPVHAAGEPVAVLTVVGALPVHLPLLRAFGAVLALALGRPAGLPRDLLAAADADADAAADALHDGPVQELVFARLAADAAVRGGDVGTARDAVQAALQSLRRTLWMLRPRGAADGGLGPALTQLADRLVESGRPRPSLQLDDEACRALPPEAASVAYRLVQALVRSEDVPVPVRVGRSADVVTVVVEAAPPTPPERWAARAAALGATLDTSAAGRTTLSVPVAPRTAPCTPPDPDIEASP
ncbi:MAG TPA: hypothetical protein VM433_04265 [Mycobacteriales bacterium]|nr:hypothetical protein [Mycobacteriales bacterium]